MKRYFSLSILTLAFGLLVFCILSQGMADVDAATNHSEMSLYGFLATMPEMSNSAVSPHAVKWLAAMLYAGADNQTANELKVGFRFEDDPEQVARRLKEVTADTQSLRIANGMWTAKQLDLKADFHKSMKNDFGAYLAVCDFENEPETALCGINKWIGEQTGGKIDSLFDRLRSDTQLVLVNTIHFQSNWLYPFDSKQTKHREFTRLDGQKTELDMMQKQLRCAYGENENVLCMELPYSQGNLAMLFILPKNAADWQKVETFMSEKTINGWRMSMAGEEVDCMIPKMDLTASFDLRDVFANLGIESPFSAQEADFTKMSNHDLFVSCAIQNVRVEVDETGTVASAATGAVIVPKSLPLAMPERKQFYANRPFWFIIRNTETGTIFFLGRFVGSAVPPLN